jgi:hypothetical protein
VSAVALTIVGGYAVWTTYQLSKTETKLAQAKQLQQDAEIARDLAINANKTNQDTIDKLQKEKMDIEKSIAALEADRRRNAKIIGDLSITIRGMAADPANQVTLSPVLRETIRQIQANRQGAAK